MNKVICSKKGLGGVNCLDCPHGKPHEYDDRCDALFCIDDRLPKQCVSVESNIGKVALGREIFEDYPGLKYPCWSSVTFTTKSAEEGKNAC